MEVTNMIRFYESELERVGVSVQLNTEVDQIDLTSWDTVLLATGTVPQEQGLDVVDMLANQQLPEAAEITVFGETESAMFAALWLAENGKKVSLVSPAQDVGVDTNDMQRGHLTELLKAQGVSMKTSGVQPVDGTIVMATTRIASTVKSELVNDHSVQSIGTRAHGGRMYEATQSGFWAASKIGEAL
jgi:2,4-dienoyl-CoA reductase (NADPH2)